MMALLVWGAFLVVVVLLGNALFGSLVEKLDAKPGHDGTHGSE